MTKVSLPWMSWACLLLAGLIILHPLSYSWSLIEEYAYGWWVAPLALLVFGSRWSTRPAPEPPGQAPKATLFILAWAILYLGTRLALETSLGSRPLNLFCALLYVGALLYWLWLHGGKSWVRHFAFPVCFLLVAVPWPVPIEEPLAQGLMRLVTWLVAHVLIILGIYAQAMGNVIVLSNCNLGVEAACSGIRSLQAALMISLLAGEFFQFTWPRRGKIVLLAFALALAGNFLRALFLSLMASAQGAKAIDRWHDTAGNSILIFTSVALLLVCYLLQRFGTQAAPLAAVIAPPKLPPQTQTRGALRLACGILLAAVLGESATQGWYAWGERGGAIYPTWTAQMPASGTAQVVPIPRESSDLLQYSEGREVKWQDARGWRWTAYWFRYHPKPLGDVVFQTHNPDICLPDAGFNKVSAEDPFIAETSGLRLHVYPGLFNWKGIPVYVFWIVYANRASFPQEKLVLTPVNFADKTILYFSNIWNARRTSTSETESFEAIITGPENYAAAKAGYLEELRKIVAVDGLPASSR